MVFDEDATIYPCRNCRECIHYCEVRLLSGERVDACVTRDGDWPEVEVLEPGMAEEGCEEYEERD